MHQIWSFFFPPEWGWSTLPETKQHRHIFIFQVRLSKDMGCIWTSLCRAGPLWSSRGGLWPFHCHGPLRTCMQQSKPHETRLCAHYPLKTSVVMRDITCVWLRWCSGAKRRKWSTNSLIRQIASSPWRTLCWGLCWMVWPGVERRAAAVRGNRQPHNWVKLSSVCC